MSSVATKAGLQTYQAKNYDSLIGTPGFSEKLLTNHIKLYQGYVANTNVVGQKLGEIEIKPGSYSPEFAELKRRFAWEFNGMRLHEYYFDNMGGTNKAPSAAFVDAVTKTFGSLEKWKDDFLNTGSMRGIGWVILYKDPVSGNLYNTWIDEHSLGHLAGCPLILVMDVFEHAFMVDYGLDRKSYLNAFYAAINWDAVSKRIGA